jgi:hypothetical protein
MPTHMMSRLAAAAGIGVAAFFFAMPSAHALIVSEGKLAQYCGEEAAIKLNTQVNKLMLLPVEKSRGKFHVYGQTDAANPTLFECVFDGRRKFLSIAVQGDHDHGQHAAGGAPKPAINKCLQMVGVPANVEKVSALKPGFSEIIIKEKASARRVACTVPDDGSLIEDWVEMN